MSDSIASVIGLKDTYAGFFREMIWKESNMDHHPIHVRLVNHGVSVKTAFPSPNISKKITTSNGSRKTITARITSGPVEGRNKYIKLLLKLANGYANFKRFRNRTM